MVWVSGRNSSGVPIVFEIPGFDGHGSGQLDNTADQNNNPDGHGHESKKKTVGLDGGNAEHKKAAEDQQPQKGCIGDGHGDAFLGRQFIGPRVIQRFFVKIP
jgi:hypothetical protein